MRQKEKIDFNEWAAGLYAREVRGNVVGAEFNNGIPVEIPIPMQTPETLEQQISRLVRAYSADTGQYVETLDEANDFSIPGEDEDYEEDDYIVHANAVRAGEAEASAAAQGAATEGTKEAAPADSASVVPPASASGNTPE